MSTRPKKETKTMSIKETGRALGVSRATLHRWSQLYEATKGKKGLGPLISLGKRRKGYPIHAIMTAANEGVDA